MYWSVPCAQSGANSAEVKPGSFAGLGNPRERLFEVQANIVCKRFERRNVEDRDFVAERIALRFAHEAIDRPHEGGQSLTTTRWRAQEDIMPILSLRLGNQWPSDFLSVRGRAEAHLEPCANGRMEVGE